MAKRQEEKVLAAVLASEDGDAIARLAEGYYYGRGREKNLRTALQLWERAAALGNARGPVLPVACVVFTVTACPETRRRPFVCGSRRRNRDTLAHAEAWKHCAAEKADLRFPGRGRSD